MAEKIVPGMLVYVKTSGETGQVISLNQSPLGEEFDSSSFSGQTALVRIPKASQSSGVYMLNSTFAVEELETTKDRQSREYEDMFGMSEMMKGKVGQPQDLKSLIEPAGTDEDLPN